MMTTFVTTRRVEFGDTDMAGIVHFANFFRYMEAAETDFLHSRGLSVAFLRHGEKFGFPRVRASCDYHQPARFGDVLRIVVMIEKIGKKSVQYRHEFYRGDDHIATGSITSVFCRKTVDGIESLVIPDDIRQLLDGSPSEASA